MTTRRELTTPRARRGRAAVDRGKATERAVAYRALPPYWPEAKRARDNGSEWTPDMGDVVNAGDLFWSVKGDRSAREPAKIAAWTREMQEKAGPDRMGVLVERRDRVADPLRWWAWVWSSDLVQAVWQDRDDTWPNVLVRLELGDLLDLFACAGLTAAIPERTRQRPPLDRLEFDAIVDLK